MLVLQLSSNLNGFFCNLKKHFDFPFYPLSKKIIFGYYFIVTLVTLLWSMIYILRRSAGKLQKPVTNAPLFSENSFFKGPNLYRFVWRPNLIHKRGFANNALCNFFEFVLRIILNVIIRGHSITTWTRRGGRVSVESPRLVTWQSVGMYHVKCPQLSTPGGGG